METATSSSSVNAVVSNDDLLIEILVRLPVISLILFKFVSKRWLSLITSPSFNLRLTRIPNLHPPSDVFLQKRKSPYKYEFAHDFKSLDIRIPADKSPFTFGSDSSNVEVLQSCNGLLLCSIRTYLDKFYVYNPSINLFKKLPQVRPINNTFEYSRDHMMLAFDPTTSPHYKVLHIRLIDDDDDVCLSFQTQTYSSETGIWSIGDILPLESFSGRFARGVNWNGAIHWLDKKNRVMHFKFDVERPRLISTQPPGTLGGELHTDHKLFESRGCLLFTFMVDTHPKHLKIYEMRNEYSGWSVKFLVKHEDIISTFLKTWEMSTKEFNFRILCIVVGEREEDSFVVMNIDQKVVQYNLLSKTLHMLCDFGPVDHPYNNFDAFPFFATFAGV